MIFFWLKQCEQIEVDGPGLTRKPGPRLTKARAGP